MEYKDVESEFLEAMATKYEFEGNTRTAFLIRFREKDAEMDNKNLSIEYATELTLNTRQSRENNNNHQEPNAEIILRDRLRVICDKFENPNESEQEGCQYNSKTKGKWKIAKAWLREKVFPEWVKQQQKLNNPISLWQQLWNRVTSTTGITIKDIAKPNTLGIDATVWGGSKENIPQFSSRESKLIYEIEIKQGGYLILLEKSSEQVYCFSPSCLVKKFYHPAGVHNFPYKVNPFQITYIPLEEGISSTEEIVAIVSQTQPSFSWLKSETEPPLELDKTHLKDLLDFLDREQELEMMSARYLVTA